MRYTIAVVFALALAACSDRPIQVASMSPTLPPLRYQDCVDFALLDDACTRKWYSCRLGTDDPSSCVHAWEECCSLRGQGARSRLISAAPQDR